MERRALPLPFGVKVEIADERQGELELVVAVMGTHPSYAG
jgi:hypothetical protein